MIIKKFTACLLPSPVVGCGKTGCCITGCCIPIGGSTISAPQLVQNLASGSFSAWQRGQIILVYFINKDSCQ
ncbi:MAG TPA: hypothetical protein VKH37_11910, partial [Ferruginibacter sp.]|nr:hypothetical protein [Ferruginibacter sp.]